MAQTMAEQTTASDKGGTLLDVRDLVMHFPLTRGIVLQRKVGAVQAVDGVSFSVTRGETLGLVGRVRLWQKHHGPRDPATVQAHGWRSDLRGA